MEQAMNMVEQLAVKLGVAAEQLWVILVRQQYAEGVIDIILAALCVIILITTIVYAPKLTDRMSNEYKRLVEDRKINGTGYLGSKHTPSCEEDRYDLLRKNIPAIAVTVGCLSLIFIIMFIVSGVQQIINPEYFALKEILDCIKYGN